MDLYQAGGYNDGSGAEPPAEVSFPAGPAKIVVFLNTGRWTCNFAVAEYGPDGTTTGRCEHSGGQNIANPVGPFSGYSLTDFVGALAGVFLEDTLPAVAPPPLRFYVTDSSQGGIQTDFQILSPLIGQIFFIGDGFTGTASGNPQIFRIPPGATHLYLGYVDNCNSPEANVPGCYFDNAGSVTANLRILYIGPN
jgi:hypothetical protein